MALCAYFLALALRTGCSVIVVQLAHGTTGHLALNVDTDLSHLSYLSFFPAIVLPVAGRKAFLSSFHIIKASEFSNYCF